MIRIIVKTFIPTILMTGCNSNQLLETEQLALNDSINQPNELTLLTPLLARSANLSDTQLSGGAAALFTCSQHVKRTKPTGTRFTAAAFARAKLCSQLSW